MRHASAVALLLTLALTAGCGRECDSNDGGTAQATTPPAAAAEGGMVGITLDLPDPWKAYPKPDRTDFWAGSGKHFSLWSLPAGTTEEAAVADVATTILPVVKEFELVSEEDAEVAGAPAHHLFGKGVEADDGDDSLAEVYVFTVGDRVRLACVHGEGRAAELLRPDTLAILATMKPE